VTAQLAATQEWLSYMELKHLRGYVIPRVANLTEEKSLCVQRVPGMAMLVLIIFYLNMVDF
jgi:hypothetical protein